MKNFLYGVLASLTLFSGTFYAGLPFHDPIDFYFGRSQTKEPQALQGDLTGEELAQEFELEANLALLESILPGTSLSLFGSLSYDQDNDQPIQESEKKKKRTSSSAKSDLDFEKAKRRESNIMAAHKSRLVEDLLLAEKNKQKNFFN